MYALEDFSDGEGISYFIEIAKTHPKLIIRKKAIYCLNQSTQFVSHLHVCKLKRNRTHITAV